MSLTHFALLAKFGDTNIPLEKVCTEYLGLAPKKAGERACLQDLPIPAFKLGGVRSPWMVDAKKLADYIDKQKANAEIEWKNVRA